MNALATTLGGFDMETIYRIIGGVAFVFALMSFRDKQNPKRWGTGIFMGLYGVAFAFGSVLSSAAMGVCVVLMGFVAGLGGVQSGHHELPPKEQRRVDAERFGLWLFFPFILSLLFMFLLYWVGSMELLLAFAVSNIVVLVFFASLLRESPAAFVRDGHRIFDAMGWAALFPQLSVALGVVFEAAGMGDIILEVAESFVVIDGRLIAVAVYCIATAFLAMTMGNAFPAFIVITSGIGVPLLVRGFGADPAVVGTIAMTSGFCGTLMTPMAMNFNGIPAERLGIRNMNEVLKAQGKIALPLLLINIVLMYALAF